MHRDLMDRVFFSAPGTWILFRCERCGAGYLDPRPTTATVSLAYQAYFTHGPSEKRSNRELGFYHSIRRALANGYRNARFGFSMEPATRWGVLAAYLMPAMRRMLDAEMRHLPKPTTGIQLLDVGCGNGDFLEMAGKAGWEAEGIDPDPEAVAFCRKRGLVAASGQIHDLEGQERFDAITLCHVIEHVHDPVAMLNDCYRLLKPGGWIWLETPNLQSQGHKHFGEFWLGLDPPRHLVLFTRASLKRAVQVAGFVTVRDMPYRPLFGQNSEASRSIRNGSGLPRPLKPSSADRWFLSLSEWKARFHPRFREVVVLRASKPSGHG